MKAKHHLLPSFWYAAARSAEVTAKPVTRRVCGIDVTLYRLSNGQIRCVQAYCPHRGADFGLGRIKGDHLVCPYHGWEFDSRGVLACVPSITDGSCPSLQIKTFPVQEAASYIWVFPGETALSEQVPLGIPGRVQNPALRAVPFGGMWHAHHTRVVESVLDVAHLPFVHPNTIGTPDRPGCETLQFGVVESSMLIFPPGNKSKEAPPPLPRVIESTEALERFSEGRPCIRFTFPNQWLLQIPMGGERYMYQYVTFTPIDEERTMIYGLAMRTHFKNIPFFDKLVGRQSNRVLNQDKAVVESQRPRQVPYEIRAEAHVFADGPQVQYRRMLRNHLVENQDSSHA
ncbi:Rieske 2Fe-2S domain-containing protein [Aneurinibacillus sp. REN35]|uniref:Rieske 2Fe-2S domain-containing protein n=1 Tax=Aneurinibacillus sp. REN35 TaxID=3237286 RepID=UPI003527BF98